MSTSVCDLISVGYNKSCVQPKKGICKNAVILNWDDIDWASVELGADNNIVESMPLKSGKLGYAIVQFKDPFNGTSKAFNQGTYVNSFDKTVAFVTLTREQETSLKLTDPLANGKFVMVVENEDKGSDQKAAFEIYGFNNGLHLSSYEENPYGDAYSGGVYQLQEQAAVSSAMYLFDTSYSATKAIFDGYTTPPTPPED